MTNNLPTHWRKPSTASVTSPQYQLVSSNSRELVKAIPLEERLRQYDEARKAWGGHLAEGYLVELKIVQYDNQDYCARFRCKVKIDRGTEYEFKNFSYYIRKDQIKLKHFLEHLPKGAFLEIEFKQPSNPKFALEAKKVMDRSKQK